MTKVRYDSKLFAYQYLDNMKALTPNSIKIYNEFINNDKKMLPLKINVSIVKLFQKLSAPFISGEDNLAFNNNESLIIPSLSIFILLDFQPPIHISKSNFNNFIKIWNPFKPLVLDPIF